MNLARLFRFVRRYFDRRDAGTIAAVAASVLIAWIIGRSVSRLDFTVPLLFAGATIFFLMFFRKESLLVLTPLVFCIPNFGLDIPGPWAISIQDAYVGTAFIALVTRGIIRRKAIIPRGDPLVGPLILFWAVAVLSVVKTVRISPDTLMYIVKDLMRLSLLIALYLCMADVVQTAAHMRTFVRSVLLLALPMGAVSWYIYLTDSPFFYRILTMEPAYIFYKTRILRMISTAGSTSFTGLYYAVVIALAWTCYEWRADRAGRLLRGALIALAGSCLALTLNRGTWVGVLFGLAALLFLKRMNWRQTATGAFLLLGAMILMSTTFFTHFDVESKLGVIVEVSRSTGTARLVRWLSAVNVILAEPFLGVGYNNYAFVYGRYSIQEGLLRTYGSPHNMYVDILTGTGFIGFGIFAVFLRRLWKLHMDNLKATESDSLRALALGLFLALTFFLGASAFDSFLFKPHHTSFLVVSLWALSSGLRRITPPIPEGRTSTGGTETASTPASASSAVES